MKAAYKPQPVREYTSIAFSDAILNRLNNERATPMTYHSITYYREQIKRLGRWAAVRYMRNKGLSFEQTYFISFGKLPRIQHRST